jgi:hypothetical protein
MSQVRGANGQIYTEPMASTKKKPAPEFGSEDEEREFWTNHDSTVFVDWQYGQRRKLASLKPTLEELLAERLEKERRRV